MADWTVELREVRGMKWIIDRFEGTMAVCQNETKQMRDIPRAQLPPQMKEGDVVVEDGGQYRFDPEETARRRQSAIDGTKGMWA